jgi:hypothetical protein
MDNKKRKRYVKKGQQERLNLISSLMEYSRYSNTNNREKEIGYCARERTMVSNRKCTYIIGHGKMFILTHSVGRSILKKKYNDAQQTQ